MKTLKVFIPLIVVSLFLLSGCIEGMCSDGTQSGQCSSQQPYYCDNDTLVEYCYECGCPSGYECGLSSVEIGGICTPISADCTPGDTYSCTDNGCPGEVLCGDNGAWIQTCMDIPNDGCPSTPPPTTDWGLETVEQGPAGASVGTYNSIDTDSYGQPHIVYYSYAAGDVKYASKRTLLSVPSEDEWVPETIDSNGSVGTYVSLAIDSEDNMHVAYYWSGFNYRGQLKYSVNNGYGWSDSIVLDGAETGDKGWYTSIATDLYDNPHIVYYDITNSAIKYAKKTGSTTWLVETVDEAGGAAQTSIAISSTGYPHICYYDSTNANLKYATGDGYNWDIQTVDSEGNVGDYCSIALDSDNVPHISYNDLNNWALKYATLSYADYSLNPVPPPSSWTKQTVSSLGDGGGDGHYSSIAMDNYDRPGIAHKDDFTDTLMYTYYDGASWHTETVTTDVSFDISLAIDNWGGPHISYFDDATNSLMYAHYV